VAPVEGGEAVLKVGFPHLEGEHEAAALRAYDGRGAVRLLDHDPERWALLLERCDPGTPLVDDVVEPLAHVNEQLWEAPTDGPFRTLDDEITWHAGLIEERRRLGAVDDDVVDRVLLLQRQLLDSADRHVLLHADLHCENVLLSARGWLAIDAKPLVGDPAYGLAQALANHRPTPEELPAIARRLGLDAERVRAWALCRNVELALSRTADGRRDETTLRLIDAYR
jgi:streptomycin 6-kinase